MRILADMPIPLRTVDFIRGLGHEALHVADLGMEQASDQDIISAAELHGMSVLTKDLDYGAILATTREVVHGVIILRVGDWSSRQIEQRLQRAFQELPEESFRNAIVVVDRHRVRIRRLPIS